MFAPIIGTTFPSDKCYATHNPPVNYTVPASYENRNHTLSAKCSGCEVGDPETIHLDDKSATFGRNSRLFATEQTKLIDQQVCTRRKPTWCDFACANPTLPWGK